MQAKRENIIRKIDFISICTESSTKLTAGFGSIIGDLWDFGGLSVAVRFPFSLFRFPKGYRTLAEGVLGYKH
jgi:hypothetical protein